MSIFRNLLIAKNKLGNLIDGFLVESIIFNGNSYIDTGINYQSCTINTRMSFDYKDSRMLHGWGSQASEYWGSNINNKFELGENDFIKNSDTTQIHSIEINIDALSNTTTLTVDGMTISRTGNGSIPNSTYKIGCINDNYYFYGKVYSHSIKNENGIIIQDLRPCLDSDGTPCFYDKISGEFYYNRGDNALKYVGHTRLKELDTSSIYIDTEVIPTLNTSFELITSIGPSYINGRDLFGSRNTDTSVGAFGVLSNSINNTIGFYRWGNQIECNLIDTLPHIYYLSNNKARIDNIEYSFPSGVSTNNNTYNLVIGAFNHNGHLYPASQRVKECKIWENDILIKYLIPVIRADGMECMFDLISEKYHERKY